MIYTMLFLHFMFVVALLYVIWTLSKNNLFKDREVSKFSIFAGTFFLYSTISFYTFSSSYILSTLISLGFLLFAIYITYKFDMVDTKDKRHFFKLLAFNMILCISIPYVCVYNMLVGEQVSVKFLIDYLYPKYYSPELYPNVDDKK